MRSRARRHLQSLSRPSDYPCTLKGYCRERLRSPQGNGSARRAHGRLLPNQANSARAQDEQLRLALVVARLLATLCRRESARAEDSRVHTGARARCAARRSRILNPSDRRMGPHPRSDRPRLPGQRARRLGAIALRTTSPGLWTRPSSTRTRSPIWACDRPVTARPKRGKGEEKSGEAVSRCGAPEINREQTVSCWRPVEEWWITADLRSAAPTFSSHFPSHWGFELDAPQ
jgi:hypothetical protein